MKDFDQKWQHLVTLARQAPAADDDTPPYGFATRVAAAGVTSRSLPATTVLLEKFALRGLIAAGALSVATAAFSYESLIGGGDEDVSLAAIDPVAELLDISS